MRQRLQGLEFPQQDSFYLKRVSESALRERHILRLVFAMDAQQGSSCFDILSEHEVRPP